MRSTRRCASSVLKADAIAREEPRLLELAKRNMPRLPVDAVDVLVVDRMGKDISGVGIDPNITGRIGVNGERDEAAPRVGAMVVCDLTDGTHGNAIGVGLADVITRRLFARIDYESTVRERGDEQLSRTGQDSGGGRDRSPGLRDRASELRPRA